ncbi:MULTISPECIES: prephenate dehydrogenase [Ferrimicrobium]|uniref:Prephenate dehydrogenase n=1 Tax=Ferrimicrobium acidiphilum TaxID=121039 RepID=A0ABV3Y089_9ACTN|nr:prephenate dehydrogenase/arogenate dehydrogenase family protein [Ferrimicrobium sp.]
MNLGHGPRSLGYGVDLDQLGDVGVVGLGHMGASLVGALQQQLNVVGFDRDPESIAFVRSTFNARGAESVEELVRECRVVVIATPTPEVPRVRETLEVTAAKLDLHPVVCDIASIKGDLAIGQFSGSSLRYVSLHPMAGREGNGATSADPSIFNDANWAVALTGSEDPDALATAVTLPLVLGNGVIPIRWEDHDPAIAVVSTLPHVSAVALARVLGQGADHMALEWLAAGSIRDGVRVARTDPARIVEMLHPNRMPLRRAIDSLVSELVACRDHLEDPQWLLEWARSGNDGAQAVLLRSGDVRQERVPLTALVEEFLRLAKRGRLVVSLAVDGDEVQLASAGHEASGDPAP